MNKIFTLSIRSLITAAMICTLLIAAIWTMGPYVRLTTSNEKWIAALVVGVCALLWVVVSMWWQTRNTKLAETGSMAHTTEPESAQAIGTLKIRLESAIKRLKTSRMGLWRGPRAALYELPWYMMIGASQSGKTTALQRAGLDFPFAGDGPGGVTGIEKSVSCDWHFASKAVLLDTTGRYTEEAGAKTEWLGLLQLLRKYRRRAPINGVIVSLRLDMLAHTESRTLDTLAKQLREQLHDLNRELGVFLPVYVMVTKFDTLEGFSDAFAGLTEAEREQVFGFTLPTDRAVQAEPANLFAANFDALVDRVDAWAQSQLMQPGLPSAQRNALYTFPIELAGLRPLLGGVISTLFADNPYQFQPVFRGLYFTSAAQTGHTVAPASRLLMDRYQLQSGAAVRSREPLGALESLEPPISTSYFLHDLFRKVVFGDKRLVQTLMTSRRRTLRMATVGITLAAVLGYVGLLALSYRNNAALLAGAQASVAQYAALTSDASPRQRIAALDNMQQHIRDLHGYRQSVPWKLGLGLYRGNRIEPALRRQFFAAFEREMLTPVGQYLEIELARLDVESLTGRPERTGRAQNMLKTLMLMTDRRLEQPEFLMDAGVYYARFVFADPADTSFAQLPEGVLADTAGAQETMPVPPSGSPSAATRNMSRGLVSRATSEVTRAVPGGQYLRPAVSGVTDPMARTRGQAVPIGMPPAMPAVAAPRLLLIPENALINLWRFYVSQRAEPDVPLYRTEPMSIERSRSMLRGAVQPEVKAAEVVAQIGREIMARLSPMERAELRDLDMAAIVGPENSMLMSGGGTVSGLYTRAAWERVVRPALEKAAQAAPDALAEDWVIAGTPPPQAQAQANREPAGFFVAGHGNADAQAVAARKTNAEQTYAQLKRAYFEAYAQEWHQFMQRFMLADTRTLEDNLAMLQRLSDPQRSPLVLLARRIVYETSIERAVEPRLFDQAIEKGRQLSDALGIQREQPPAPTPTFSTLERPVLEQRFGLLWAMVEGDKSGQKVGGTLAQYLEHLLKLKIRVASIVSSGDTALGARQLVMATFAQQGSELQDALVFTEMLLSGLDQQSREAFRNVLLQPVSGTWQALLTPVANDLNQAWIAEVLEPWQQQLAGRYPFADVQQEAALGDISRFFQPESGLVARYIAQYLGPMVSKQADRIVPRQWNGIALPLHGDFVASLERSSQIGRLLFRNGEPHMTLDIYPQPTVGVQEYALEVDGQTLRYRNEPQAWQRISWPASPAASAVPAMASSTGAAGARLSMVGANGIPQQLAAFQGTWGWMRLIDRARATQLDPARLQLAWSLPAGEPIRLWVRASDVPVSAFVALRHFKPAASVSGASRLPILSAGKVVGVWE